jgi:Protein of unknown function (DUF2752)
MRYREIAASGGDTSVDAARTSARATNAGRIAAAATLFAVLWAFTPPADPHFRLCGFYWLTGHPCALCGLTRAMFALAKGHFAQAEHFNALAPLGFAMVFSLFWNGRITGRLWTAGLAAFAVYGLCRLF